MIEFIKGDNGKVDGFLWKANGKEKKVRIGPLFHSLEHQTDPDPQGRRRSSPCQDPRPGWQVHRRFGRLTPGARTDFAIGSRDLADIESVTFLAEQDVAGRKIERHKGDVSRILYYRLMKRTATDSS